MEISHISVQSIFLLQQKKILGFLFEENAISLSFHIFKSFTTPQAAHVNFKFNPRLIQQFLQISYKTITKTLLNCQISGFVMHCLLR